MTRLSSNRMASFVGTVTLAMGTSLTFAPHRTSAALGLGDPRFAQTLGVTDLVLAPGLFRGRWRWMTARATLNLVIAQHYRAEARNPGSSGKARTGAIVMTALTVVDGSLAVALRTSRPRSS